MKLRVYSLSLALALVGGLYWKLGRQFPAPPIHSNSIVEKSKENSNGKRPEKISLDEPDGNPAELIKAVQKIQILKTILQSKNDNDPRLDQDFNQLTPADKKAMEKEYLALRSESRNERGTIIFLLGRNLNSPDDFDFLKGVVSEPPCLSLSDCDSSAASVDVHTETTSGMQITLEYPQIVALKSLETYLSENPNSVAAIEVIQKAMQSKSLIVSQMANELFNTQKSRDKSTSD